jgi:hypothetical protein
MEHDADQIFMFRHVKTMDVRPTEAAPSTQPAAKRGKAGTRTASVERLAVLGSPSRAARSFKYPETPRRTHRDVQVGSPFEFQGRRCDPDSVGFCRLQKLFTSPGPAIENELAELHLFRKLP